MHTLIRVRIRSSCHKIDLICLYSSKIVFAISVRFIVGVYSSTTDVEDSRNNSYDVLSR